MRRIGGEIVPEMLEIDAFAALDQRQRRLAVEVEMPEVAQQPDLRPVADAGQERIHQRDAADVRRILGGIGIGDHQPDVVAGDADIPQAKRHGKRVDVRGHGLLVVAAFRLVRCAEAAQVRGDHRMRLGELGDQRPPHMAVLGIAVQQDHRRAGAGSQVVKPGSVDLGEAVLDRHRIGRASRRNRGERSDDACQRSENDPYEKVHGVLLDRVSILPRNSTAR